MHRVQHRSFNPFDTDVDPSQDEYSYPDLSDSFEGLIINKGEKVFQIDLKKVEHDVKDLLKCSDTKICDLDHDDKKRLDSLKLKVQCVYDTPYYHDLHACIVKHCKHISCPRPGTVGGYLSGCLLGDSENHASATPVCADGLPMPRDDDVESCSSAVFWAEYVTTNGGNKYEISVVRKGESSDDYSPAFLFIDACDSHSFKGFSPEEKHHLKEHGVNHVRVFGYRCENDSISYPELYDTAIALKDIKMRNSDTSTTNNTNLAIILIVIFLIILILLFGWRIWNRGVIY